MASFVSRWRLNGCPPLFNQDAFQEEYYRTGTYPAVPIVPPRRPWTLLNWLFWALLLLYPLFKLLINMINSGSSLTLASFAFVIVMGKFSETGRLLSDMIYWNVYWNMTCEFNRPSDTLSILAWNMFNRFFFVVISVWASYKDNWRRKNLPVCTWKFASWCIGPGEGKQEQR